MEDPNNTEIRITFLMHLIILMNHHFAKSYVIENFDVETIKSNKDKSIRGYITVLYAILNKQYIESSTALNECVNQQTILINVRNETNELNAFVEPFISSYIFASTKTLSDYCEIGTHTNNNKECDVINDCIVKLSKDIELIDKLRKNIIDFAFECGFSKCLNVI